MIGGGSAYVAIRAAPAGFNTGLAWTVSKPRRLLSRGTARLNVGCILPKRCCSRVKTCMLCLLLHGTAMKAHLAPCPQGRHHRKNAATAFLFKQKNKVA